MTWSFRTKPRNEKIRNPIQGEFFATDAIAGPAQALIRESIQNSLDAASGAGPVQMRIYLATGDDALPSERIAALFKGAWPHYTAPGNGLRDPPNERVPCPYLVIEDFATRGLTGDPAQSEPYATPNPFFLFFRAEGLSAKDGIQLGRWGIGKFVFPRSSQISTHFGVTVRHDDKRRLMLGAATLKAHRIAGVTDIYSPDGLYGVEADDGFVMPIDDATEIDGFCELFGLQRGSKPGLSVVVPFVDPEITFDGLLSASVKDYFLPVLDGRLEITVADRTRSVALNTVSLEQTVAEFASQVGPAIQSYVKLARWASSLKAEDRITLLTPDPARAVKWTDALVPPAAMEQLRERLSVRQTIAVRVPVTVRERNKAPVQSHFDIYLAPDKTSDGRPLFVREGIIISDVRGARARELRAMVVVADRSLATMLGDSENPAHTQWQKDSSNFRGKYIYGPSVIDFITTSVGELLAIVTHSAQEADPSLTIDFFSIEPPDDNDDDTEETDRRRRRPRRGDESDDSEVKIEPRPTSIRVTRVPRGFSVQPGSRPPPVPFLVEVKCAYDVRSGNPLKKWDPADFKLGSSEVPIECDGGVRIEKIKGNWVLLRVVDDEFTASVTGFDELRDVFVRAEVHAGTGGGANADQEA